MTTPTPTDTITYGTLHFEGAEISGLTLEAAREAQQHAANKGYIVHVVQYVNGKMNDLWDDEYSHVREELFILRSDLITKETTEISEIIDRLDDLISLATPRNES